MRLADALVSGDTYLGGDASDRREISAVLVAISLGVSKLGVKKVVHVDHFGLSDTNFVHLIANISKQQSKSQCHTPNKT